MFQYKAILRSNGALVAEGHTITDVSHQVKAFRRMQRKGEHTSSNVPIDIFHVKRNKLFGRGKCKEELIKVI